MPRSRIGLICGSVSPAFYGLYAMVGAFTNRRTRLSTVGTMETLPRLSQLRGLPHLHFTPLPSIVQACSGPTNVATPHCPVAAVGGSRISRPVSGRLAVSTG